MSVWPNARKRSVAETPTGKATAAILARKAPIGDEPVRGLHEPLVGKGLKEPRPLPERALGQTQLAGKRVFHCNTRL